MAQSQVTSPSVGALAGAAPWDNGGGVSAQLIDIWGQLPSASLAQPLTTIALKADPTQIPRVLSAWRAAERRLADHIEASPVRFAILSEIARLRIEYHRLSALATR